MKRLVFSLILMMLACGVASAATPVTVPAKHAVSKNTKVYYVVVQSFSTLAGAKEFLRICPDAVEGPIYTTTVKGKRVYRVCPACYYKKSDAIEYANSLNEFIAIGAWVWPSNGLAKCVDQTIGLDGEPMALDPQ